MNVLRLRFRCDIHCIVHILRKVLNGWDLDNNAERCDSQCAVHKVLESITIFHFIRTVPSPAKFCPVYLDQWPGRWDSRPAVPVWDLIPAVCVVCYSRHPALPGCNVPVHVCHYGPTSTLSWNTGKQVYGQCSLVDNILARKRDLRVNKLTW